MALRIEPLTEFFGASVSGFDAREPLSAETQEEISAAFEDFSVLVFHDQPLTDEQQITFSKYFGPLEETLPGLVGSGSKIVRVSNMLADGSLKEPGSHLALFGAANLMWHSDSTFKAAPAKGSILSARQIVKQGGDTEYASGRAAYDSLSADMKQRLDGLVAIHSIATSRRKVDPNAVSPEQETALPPVPQALVRPNPVNSRKALVLGSHIGAIVGMADDEAMALIDELTEIATQDTFTYRHVWRPNDVVMWDNRAVLHRGRPYDEANERRLMVRTTLAGDGPTAVDGRVIV
ncbi:MAG: TauD/TfdA family dioxygenase [Alphaproteobacteria bacterium]|jgi:alpha-ketoglutarate-dependent 2,4-dichlorophenoxyacetate dioxygenase|nr:TauD/TfdA family dioxygenase [Alphaproteobacteria bacterium]MDP6256580.1 TauD/TfdA family dioxygenase [Alphaproteobacteria bacterium]MDP7055561.1 TauD/TfdA family dioxygenase [Alphaproteobacteria bacterium]MDP7229425.1 TauD/TfdA family dioxygenase [Alphaproteobacteria bacterium]MDP7459308.1 TauD/TfdA family dioxygenase [Alphaproteobacteria bacterium]|tara:strand:+ start:18272 stop:19147 length:876 start_codon:yes stop_codon:yes gene_type:complete